jgi:hypothetical protein
MPAFTDITQFLTGNAFGRPSLVRAKLTGKTYIVTGANTGLGFEASLHL